MSVSYCFIGGMIFPSQFNEVKVKSKCGLQNAANTFQLAFIDGLSSNLNHLDIINLPFIGSWPINYKSIFAPKTEQFKYTNHNGHMATCENISFINLTYLKNHFREIGCYNALNNYCHKHNSDDFIYLITYTLHQPFLRAVKKIKRKYNNVRSIVIVTDLPEFKNDIIPSWKKLFLDYDTHISKEEYNSADGFILLTKAMANKVIFNQQPYEIIEGLFTPTSNSYNDSILQDNSDDIKTILYSGTLAKRYNIINLVHAVSNIQDKTIRLQICGSGNSKDEILKLAEKNSRIEFLGELSREEVMKLQRKASLLVNPRTDEGDYTKYSFPSKTMEYLASGTPTILYKLPGIPDEYYNYCFSLSESGVTALQAKIEEVLSISKPDLISFGKKAQEFIYTQKNSQIQTKKLLKLINHIK